MNQPAIDLLGKELEENKNAAHNLFLRIKETVGYLRTSAFVE